MLSYVIEGEHCQVSCDDNIHFITDISHLSHNVDSSAHLNEIPHRSMREVYVAASVV